MRAAVCRYLSACDVICQSKVSSEGRFVVCKCQAIMEFEEEEEVFVLNPLLRMRQSLLYK